MSRFLLNLFCKPLPKTLYFLVFFVQCAHFPLYWDTIASKLEFNWMLNSLSGQISGWLVQCHSLKCPPGWILKPSSCHHHSAGEWEKLDPIPRNLFNGRENPLSRPREIHPQCEGNLFRAESWRVIGETEGGCSQRPGAHLHQNRASLPNLIQRKDPPLNAEEKQWLNLTTGNVIARVYLNNKQHYSNCGQIEHSPHQLPKAANMENATNKQRQLQRVMTEYQLWAFCCSKVVITVSILNVLVDSWGLLEISSAYVS